VSFFLCQYLNDLIQKLLDHCKNLDHQANKDGISPLHILVRSLLLWLHFKSLIDFLAYKGLQRIPRLSGISSQMHVRTGRCG
jgi:hypothetical protein